MQDRREGAVDGRLRGRATGVVEVEDEGEDADGGGCLGLRASRERYSGGDAGERKQQPNGATQASAAGLRRRVSVSEAV